jgi:hypothetical protein
MLNIVINRVCNFETRMPVDSINHIPTTVDLLTRGKKLQVVVARHGGGHSGHDRLRLDVQIAGELI